MSDAVNGNNLLLGRGKVYFDRFDASGASTGERFLGNVSRFELSTEDETKEKYSAASKGAGLIKKVVVRRTPMLSLTLDEFSPENVALALMGSIGGLGQDTGTITSRAIADVVQGRFYPVGARRITNVVVTGSGGTPSYDVDDDYTVDAVSGRIYIVPDGGIADGADLEVSCSHGADNSTVIAGGASTVIEGSVRYVGDPQSGPAYEVEVWRGSVATEGVIGLISDEFAEAPLKLEVQDVSGSHPEEPFYRLIALGTYTA